LAAKKQARQCTDSPPLRQYQNTLIFFQLKKYPDFCFAPPVDKYHNMRPESGADTESATPL
jgi:hypothetical protein